MRLLTTALVFAVALISNGPKAETLTEETQQTLSSAWQNMLSGEYEAAFLLYTSIDQPAAIPLATSGMLAALASAAQRDNTDPSAAEAFEQYTQVNKAIIEPLELVFYQTKVNEASATSSAIDQTATAAEIYVVSPPSVNARSEPTTDSVVLDGFVSGDVVTAIERVTGADGHIWIKGRSETREKPFWIRSDMLRLLSRE